MPLTFPTLAEQAIAAFRASTKTKPFEAFAIPLGAEKEYEKEQGVSILWTFPDDTSVRVQGRGKAYKLEALLP